MLHNANLDDTDRIEIYKALENSVINQRYKVETILLESLTKKASEEIIIPFEKLQFDARGFPKRINFIKDIRDANSHLGLKEAKEICDRFYPQSLLNVADNFSL